MALPLLIAKKEHQPICPDDYKLGWLFQDEKEGYWMIWFQDEKEGYWMIWGSCKNKETALSAVKEVLEKQGVRDVFISEVPLSKHLTKEQVERLIPLKD